jgi:similar to stage IV sporulation protein
MFDNAGYGSFVTLTIWGQSPEKVINMAVSRGIALWSVQDLGNRRWSLTTNVAGVRPLFQLARRGGCHLKINEKKGPVFWLANIKRRKSLAVGCLLFCLGLFWLSRFIWFVEVNCPTPLLEQKTREIMGEYGLTRFSLRRAVNIDVARGSLARELPEAAWIGVELEGCRLRVEVVEKLHQDDPVLSGCGDLVAANAGTIQELLVLQGRPVVSVGQTVQKGQVLIAGIQPAAYPEYGLQRIQAKGVIRARVSREVYANCPLEEEILEDTGRQSTWYQISAKGRTIRLNGVPQPPYPRYRMVKNVKTLWQGRNQGDIVEMIAVIYKEQKRSVLIRTPQEAVAESLRRAQLALAKMVPEDCRILEQKALPVEAEAEGQVQIRLLIETLEDIGDLQLASAE